MHKSGLVSIIIPVYNVKKYLSKCIRSVLKQTYSNLQIILVDDGSTDGCGSICDNFGRQDTRIQVIHKIRGVVISKKCRVEGCAGRVYLLSGFR